MPQAVFAFPSGTPAFLVLPAEASRHAAALERVAVAGVARLSAQEGQQLREAAGLLRAAAGESKAPEASPHEAQA